MFSKRHYEWLARWITNLDLYEDVYEEIAHKLADELERDNPKFDRTRFLKACDVDDI